MNARPIHLNTRQIARAWADPVYRASLTSEQRRQMPTHPAGTGEEVLDEVRGWGDPTMWSCIATCQFSCITPTCVGCRP